MNKNINKSKIYMIICICILCISILGSSFAYYRKELFNTNANTITYGLDYYINYAKGQDISGAELQLSTDYTSGNNSDIELWKKDNTYDIYGHIYLDVNQISSSMSESSALKYTVVNNGNIISQGSLKGSSAGDSILLSANNALQTTKQLYTIYIWLDINEDYEGLVSGETLSLTVRCEATMKPIAVSVNYHITNLYNNSEKTEVNAADGITYNYATSASLMNDRFGNSAIGINDGNIRYYGANPNNYIDIGDVYEQDTVVKNWIEPMKQLGLRDSDIPTDSNSCKYMIQCSVLVSAGFFSNESTCEAQLPYMLQSFGYQTTEELCSTRTVPAGTTKSLYRIIGLFKNVELADGTKKDLIKVIRDESIGNYSWDQSESTVNNGFGVNEWNQADLMKLLNPTYESETVGGSLYWNSGLGNCYGYDTNSSLYTSVPCDFTNKGLSTSAQGKIETVKWNLGGWNSSSVFANQMYSYERQGNVVQNPSDGIQRSTVWSGRVALAYPSDYGYAVDLSTCRSYLYDYNSCKGTNWMYNSMTVNGISWSWLLTPNSVRANNAWYVLNDGYVNSFYNVNDDNGVSPVFYLDSELTVESGTGISNDPYVLW